MKNTTIYKVCLVAAAAVFAVFGGVRGDVALQTPGDFRPLAEAMATNPAAVLSPQISSIDARAFKVACAQGLPSAPRRVSRREDDDPQEA